MKCRDAYVFGFFAASMSVWSNDYFEPNFVPISLTEQGSVAHGASTAMCSVAHPQVVCIRTIQGQVHPEKVVGTCFPGNFKKRVGGVCFLNKIPRRVGGGLLFRIFPQKGHTPLKKGGFSDFGQKNKTFSVIVVQNCTHTSPSSLKRQSKDNQRQSKSKFKYGLFKPSKPILVRVRFPLPAFKKTPQRLYLCGFQQ